MGFKTAKLFCLMIIALEELRILQKTNGSAVDSLSTAKAINIFMKTYIALFLSYCIAIMPQLLLG